MNSADLIAALNLPPGARVDQRVPKKLLVENGAPTATDKRKINEGIEEVSWLAALKPTTIGVPEFRDATREYLEIAMAHAVLRAAARTARLVALIHRAIPYPVFLIATQGDALSLSLSHKRRSQAVAGATVLDGEMVIADSEALRNPTASAAFLSEMAVTRQPRGDLFELYQGWMDTVVALLAAHVTGKFTLALSAEAATARRTALAECAGLEAQMVSLRASAAKERQIARQVELNLQLKRVQAKHAAVRAKL